MGTPNTRLIANAGGWLANKTHQHNDCYRRDVARYLCFVFLIVERLSI
jgi:hypothetical protein